MTGWYFPDSLGDTETYAQALARRLPRNGYRVAIAAPDSKISEERPYAPHETLAVWRDALEPPTTPTTPTTPRTPRTPRTMDAVAADYLNLYADGRRDEASLDVQRCERV